MWIIVMVSMGMAWAGYTAVFRPSIHGETATAHAAEIDLRLPENSLDH
jgi:hypothetical protein